MEIYEFLKLIPGSCDEIYSAMDTNDTLKIVTAARNTIKRFPILEKVLSVKEVRKLNTDSKKARQVGNKCYKEGNFRTAIEFYNLALSLTRDDSEEKVLAYSNRSAAFFSIRHFSACIDDITTCLSMTHPANLADKLQKRLQDAKKVAPADLYMETRLKQQDSFFFLSLFKEYECNIKKHADVPCAIADVTFIQNGVKCIKAEKDIKVGSIVAVEKAFVCCKPPDARFTSCYYCNKITQRLHPCPGCTQALFCSEDCRDLCIKEYHSIECQIIEYLLPIYSLPYIKLALLAAIKISLKISWEVFVEASQNIGVKRMNTATVRETYNSDEPLSILCYDDIKILTEGKMFSGSIYCAAIMQRLEMVPNYFPKDFTKRKAAIEAMSRVILHLYATFTNTVLIICSAFDLKSRSYTYGAQGNHGWFSMCSKLKHSCEPNLCLVGLNDSVALIALRTIGKGEDLTISYIENYDTFQPNGRNNQLSRSIRIFAEIRHMCNCRVCLQEYDAINEVFADMPKEQPQIMLFDRLDNYSIFRALDKLSWGTAEHKTAYNIFKTRINAFQCSSYTENKIYMNDDELIYYNR